MVPTHISGHDWDALDAFDAHVALLDRDGVIVAVNAAWERLASENGRALTSCGVGRDYLAACQSDETDQDAGAAADGISRVLSGTLPVFTMEYPCHTPDKERWFSMTVRPLRGSDSSGAVVIHTDMTPLHIARERERHEQRRFASLIERAVDLITVMDHDGTITYESPAFERMLGHETAEAAGTDAFTFLHPDDVELFRTALADTALVPAGSILREYRMRHRDGSWRWIEADLTNRLDDPEICGIVVNSRDITARKEVETDRAQRAESFSTLFDATAEAMVIHDGTVFVAVNQAYADLIGLEPDQIAGRPLLELVAPASQVLAVEQMRARSEVPYDLVARRPDGSTFLVELLGRPIRYDDRSLRLLTVHDVTQQRADEAALQASEARFRAVWEATSDALALSAPDGTVLATNPAYQALYGYDDTAIVGHSCAVVFPEEHRAWAEDQHRAIFASQEPPQVFEAEVRRKDGLIRSVEVRADFVIEGGQPTALVSVIRDVTDRRVAEAALQASEERLRLALDATEMGVFQWDPVTDRTDADSRLLQMVGLDTSDEFSLKAGVSRYIGVRDRDRERYAAAVRAMLDPTGPGRLAEEVRWTGSDGRERWLAFSGQSFFEGTGATKRAVRIVGGVFDVTARKRVEEALRTSEVRFRALVQDASDIVVVLGAEGQFLYGSQALERVLGFSEASFADTLYLDMVHPDDLEKVRRAWKSAIQTPASRVQVTYRTRTVTSDWVWLDGIMTNLLDVPEVGGIVINVRDVTEQKHLESQLRHLASIVESSQDAIYGKTLDGIVTSWNLAAERLYQYPASEMIGQSLTKLLLPNAPNEFAELDKRVSRGEYVEAYETLRRAKDGRNLDVALTISPILDSEDRIVGASTIARDITERKRLIEERDRLYAELQTEVTRTAEIQAHLLPRKAPNLPGFDFAAACLPAREVGGDFYDWSAAGNQVRLSLGDVTGKGMPAALLMATARAALRAVSSDPVDEALTTVNRALGPDLEQSAAFVTLFHADLEQDGRLTYADAGHGMAMILRQDNSVEPLQQRSLPILPETRYSSSNTQLEPGDTLVIYSDGLPDARPDLGLNEPADVARLCMGEHNVHQLLNRLVNLAKDSGPRPDDLTVICVRRQETNS